MCEFVGEGVTIHDGIQLPGRGLLVQPEMVRPRRTLCITWHSQETLPLLEQQVDTKQYSSVPVMDLEPAEVARTHLTAISEGHGSQRLCAMSSSLVHTLDFLGHLK